MYSRLILLLGLLAGSIFMMMALYGLSESRWNRKAGFNRKIKTGLLSKEHETNLGVNSYYLAGCTSSRIYLGNSIANAIITEIDTSFQHFRPLELKVQDSIAWNGLMYSVDSPMVFGTERITPAYVITSLDVMAADSVHRFAQPIFQFIHLSPRKMAAVAYDRRAKENMLNTFLVGQITNARSLKIRRADGIFATDGILLSTPQKTGFIYVYYYSNDFLLMDTALNIGIRGKTIDTISVPDLQVTQTTDNRRTALSKPVIVVNARADADSNYLYILSPRMADNERNHKNKTVVDMYSLATGKYHYSFYIPLPLRDITSFKVFQHRLYIIHGSYLRWYDLQRL